MPPPAMNRRDFVWSAAKVTAILALAGCLGEENHPAAPEPAEAEGFDPTTLTAVCDRLLPGTPGALPSASEAGVADFVMRELDAPMFSKVKPFVAKGLAHLSAEAQKEKGTPFAKQESLKLGTHCHGSREYEQYALREYLSYKIFNLFTPRSFRARLAKARYVDSKDGALLFDKYAMFLESRRTWRGGWKVASPRCRAWCSRISSRTR